MNNMLLIRAEKWLNELGIKTERDSNMLKVNRTDIMNVIAEADSEILGELKKAVGSPRLCWGGKDDNWLFLEGY